MRVGDVLTQICKGGEATMAGTGKRTPDQDEVAFALSAERGLETYLDRVQEQLEEGREAELRAIVNRMTGAPDSDDLEAMTAAEAAMPQVDEQIRSWEEDREMSLEPVESPASREIAARVARVFHDHGHGYYKIYLHGNLVTDGWDDAVRLVVEVDEPVLAHMFTDRIRTGATAFQRLKTAIDILLLLPDRDLLAARLGKPIDGLMEEEKSNYQERTGDAECPADYLESHRAYLLWEAPPAVDILIVEQGWHLELDLFQRFFSDGIDRYYAHRVSREALQFDPESGEFKAPEPERKWRLGRAQFLWKQMAGATITMSGNYGLLRLLQELKEDITLEEIGVTPLEIKTNAVRCAEIHRTHLVPHWIGLFERGRLDRFQPLRDDLAIAEMTIEEADLKPELRRELERYPVSPETQQYLEAIKAYEA